MNSHGEHGKDTMAGKKRKRPANGQQAAGEASDLSFEAQQRLFDAVVLGCIPVIIADHIELPFEAYLDYRAFTVKILDADVDKLDAILRNVAPDVVKEKQRALAIAAKHLVYSESVADGDAFDMVLWKLWEKARPFRASANDAWV